MNVEVFDLSSNLVVAQVEGRSFPGVLLQGDTLKIIWDEINELLEELESQDIESAQEISIGLRDRFYEILTHYEKVLAKESLPLPYIKALSFDNNASHI